MHDGPILLSSSLMMLTASGESSRNGLVTAWSLATPSSTGSIPKFCSFMEERRVSPESTHKCSCTLNEGSSCGCARKP